ncbi:MAG TPA: hypothetical protein VHX86_08810 [Tepidisphaeraceae bacterium]|jgi:hypothetical protein|nr:hypothetical protein [Tepidisphaeraceae bacterium]
MIRRWWLGIAAVCLLTSGLLAKQGTLSTRDGRRIQGDIQRGPDGKSYNVTLHGVTVTVNDDNVASIAYPKDAADEFRRRLASLDPNDIKGRIDLSRWALTQREYDLAADAARDVQRIDPHDPDAAILLDTIASERALDTKLNTQANASTEPSPQGAAPAESASTPTVGKYLRMADVQTIRRHELLPDEQARIDFNNNVRNRYLALTGADPATFNGETPVQQALDIVQTGNEQLVRNVMVISDPTVMLEFRTRIQPRILAGCAAAGCHGSTGSGGFFLYPDADKTLVAYTNFYILQETSRKIQGGDMFGNGPVTRPMFDRLHTASSLILQFGLPRLLAVMPHPDVHDFKPMFRNEQDPSYTEMSDWISSLNPIVPDYRIKFNIPTGKPANQPAAATAPNPG